MGCFISQRPILHNVRAAVGDHRRCKAKQATTSFSPVLTAISRRPKKAAASVLPERTKPACHPERVLGTKAAPFQGDEERQFQCPSQQSNLRKPTFDPRLETFPKVLKLHAKILSGRHRAWPPPSQVPLALAALSCRGLEKGKQNVESRSQAFAHPTPTPHFLPNIP